MIKRRSTRILHWIAIANWSICWRGLTQPASQPAKKKSSHWLILFGCPCPVRPSVCVCAWCGIYRFQYLKANPNLIREKKSDSLTRVPCPIQYVSYLLNNKNETNFLTPLWPRTVNRPDTQLAIGRSTKGDYVIERNQTVFDPDLCAFFSRCSQRKIL